MIAQQSEGKQKNLKPNDLEEDNLPSYEQLKKMYDRMRRTK